MIKIQEKTKELVKEHFLYHKFRSQEEQNLMIGYQFERMVNKQELFILMFNFTQMLWIINFQDSQWWINLISNMDRIIWCQIISNQICPMDNQWWILLTSNILRIIWCQIISNQICLIMGNILINSLKIIQDLIITNIKQTKLFLFYN